MPKRMLVINFFTVFYSLQSMASNETKIIESHQKTQIVIIGTIHGQHFENEAYSPTILKNIILSSKPDVILIELPPNHIDPNGRPLEKLRDKNLPGGPECWIADTVALQLGIKLIPFDRWDKDEYYKRVNYSERQKRTEEQTKTWSEEITKNDSNCIDVQIARVANNALCVEIYFANNVGPEVINSEAFDNIVRIKHTVEKNILPTIAKKYPHYKDLVDGLLFWGEYWEERNKIMANNIVKAAREYRGKRMTIITGAEHRYILRDLLQDERLIELKEYWK